MNEEQLMNIFNSTQYKEDKVLLRAYGPKDTSPG